MKHFVRSMRSVAVWSAIREAKRDCRSPVATRELRSTYLRVFERLSFHVPVRLAGPSCTTLLRPDFPFSLATSCLNLCCFAFVLSFGNDGAWLSAWIHNFSRIYEVTLLECGVNNSVGTKISRQLNSTRGQNYRKIESVIFLTRKTAHRKTQKQM